MADNKKRGFSALDVFVVLGVILLVLGMIGQNVAVHLVDKQKSRESFELSFVVKTYENADAQDLLKKQGEAGEEGLFCYYLENAVCNVKSLHVEPYGQPSDDDSESTSLCRITGILAAKGYTEGEKNYLYGYGEISDEDVLVLSVAGKSLSFEITRVNVKKVENNT